MSKSKRVLNVIIGILMFLIGALFFLSGVEESIETMLMFIQAGMTIRGIQTLYYYNTMARFTVGGKNVLYKSIVLFDLGVLAGSLINHAMVYAVIYLALLHSFNGLVDVLRANESRGVGAQWKLKMVSGLTDIAIAVLIVISATAFKEPRVTVYIYGAGLMYSAVLRIASAFRKTDIVYIQ